VIVFSVWDLVRFALAVLAGVGMLLVVFDEWRARRARRLRDGRR
jgi:hypothetical protein